MNDYVKIQVPTAVDVMLPVDDSEDSPFISPSDWSKYGEYMTFTYPREVAEELHKKHGWKIVGAKLMPKIIKNAAQCLKCNDIVESKHRHDMVWCKCGAMAVDGGKDYLKRTGDNEFIKPMSEFEPENTELRWALGLIESAPVNQVSLINLTPTDIDVGGFIDDEWSITPQDIVTLSRTEHNRLKEIERKYNERGSE